MGFKRHRSDLTADSSSEDALRYAEHTLRLAVEHPWPRRWLRGLLVQFEIERRLRVYESYKRATGR